MVIPREAGATLGAAAAPGLSRSDHHWCTTDRPRLAPLLWPAMVTGPWLPANPSPLRRTGLPRTSPSSGPWQAIRRLGLLPPYRLMPRAEIFPKIQSQKFVPF